MKHTQIITLAFLIVLSCCSAPFISLDTVHQAYSQFQVNLILNENRNHIIILTTVSTNQSKNLANEILQSAHRKQSYASFSILVDCNEFTWNLNKTLGICDKFDSKHKSESTLDSHFSCQVFIPSEVRIQEKGHTIIKNHNQEMIPDGQHFTIDYLSEVIRKNIPDYVNYIDDQIQLTEFLQQDSQIKMSKQPKLLYFDQNQLSPLFIRKLSALMDGKLKVAVIDDPLIVKMYQSSFENLVLLQYSFDKQKYQHRVIPFDESSPEESILVDSRIAKYMKIKKNRDILMDFQHNNYTVYEFNSIFELEYLLTQGRAIIVQVSKSDTNYSCPDIYKVGEKYKTLFNYACYSKNNIKDIDPNNSYKHHQQYFFLLSSIKSGKWVNFDTPILDLLPKNSSRQMVQTQSEAQLCLRAAQASQRTAVFFYFNDKTNHHSVTIMNYLNSLPEVSSLLYFCQIVVPSQQLIKKMGIKQNTIFTLLGTDKKQAAQKLEHTQINSFIEIKMFLREIAIQKLMKVYENRIINNHIEKIQTSQQLTDKCFNRKCILALIATGKYREQQEMKIIKELKLQYEESFSFVWIDGICHWDVPKQLKLLKKKEKIIDKSYVFFYYEKDISYSLWEGKKVWDKKELEKWIKSLRNARTINHLKFAIDIQDRNCNKKGPSPRLPDEL